MKIISKSNFLKKQRKCRCPLCKTKYQYTLEECRRVYDYVQGRIGYTFICTECGHEVTAYISFNAWFLR